MLSKSPKNGNESQSPTYISLAVCLILLFRWRVTLNFRWDRAISRSMCSQQSYFVCSLTVSSSSSMSHHPVCCSRSSGEDHSSTHAGGRPLEKMAEGRTAPAGPPDHSFQVRLRWGGGDSFSWDILAQKKKKLSKWTKTVANYAQLKTSWIRSLRGSCRGQLIFTLNQRGSPRSCTCSGITNWPSWGPIYTSIKWLP